MTLKRIPTDSKDIQLIQDAVDTALIPLQQGLMATALTINNVALVSGQDNLIPHQLGRSPQIFFIGNLKVNSVVWSPDTASLSGSNWDSTRINLRCSTSCTITLWVN